MAERPTSFAQQEILAPLGAYERRAYLWRKKKISSGVVHEVPADLKKALTSNPQAFTACADAKLCAVGNDQRDSAPS